MKKTSTLFKRKWLSLHTFELEETVAEGCEWVLEGYGVATRKFDGVCCLIRDGELFARFDFKKEENCLRVLFHVKKKMIQ